MDLKFILASLVWFLIINHSHCRSQVYTVNDYGAVADGRTDNSLMFLKAWRDACATYGGVLHIPAGFYYVRGASFFGPCNGETYFQNDGHLLASPEVFFRGDFWISFRNLDGLVISGQGVFNGNGENTWQIRTMIGKFPPTSIKLCDVTNSLIQNITSVNSKTFHINLFRCMVEATLSHINLFRCQSIQINNVTITAPGNSPNTDGIHMGKSHDINITNSHITTGDDCISIGDGSRNINISSVWCGPGHGISIGSLGMEENEEDVSQINVANCNLTNTMNGLRIKTWARISDPITVSNVTFSNIHLDNVANPVIIDQYYCPHARCERKYKGESNVQIQHVKFINVKGTSPGDVAVSLHCSKSNPCQGIQLEGIHITTENGQPLAAYCSNADAQFIDDDQIPSRCSQEDLLWEYDY